jgi:hypothetical protein
MRVDKHFLSRSEVHAILKEPVSERAAANITPGNKMAIANVRERLALHFDAKRASSRAVTHDSYEVHIRVPYRTLPAEAAAPERREPTLRSAPRASNARNQNSRVAARAALPHPEVSRV